jgi:hypothetical protein
MRQALKGWLRCVVIVIRPFDVSSTVQAEPFGGLRANGSNFIGPDQ